jgi:hypothetical protein
MKMERTFLVFLIHILEQMVEMKYSSLVQELYPATSCINEHAINE